MRLGWIVAPLFLIAACGNDTDSNEDAVRDAAQEQADRYSAGDYAGVYDMWAADARAVISEDEYLKLAATCSGAGADIKVADVRVDGDDKATVRLGVGDFEQAYQMRLEDGAWKWVPTDDSLALYELGADAAIEKQRAEGTCIEG